jgi:hypothetical protein
MKKKLQTFLIAVSVMLLSQNESKAQITLLQDYANNNSAAIGTFQNINYREGGFSALYPIAGTNGKEFWTCSDRGVNVDAANANPVACRPTYDKIYGFPNYAPKIHRIRLNGNTVEILQTITMKRPNGTNASGVINPTGFGSTEAEVASTNVVTDCADFNLNTAPKDAFGIDSEGLVVDKEGNFWICEEGGPTIWKLNKNGVVIKRFTPYANLVGAESIDVQIDEVFKYRKNNRGFEGIAITPNGKIYAIIQSPILYPTKAVGEGTKIHRILEIDPTNNATRMFAYLNDGIIGASGSNQIRLRDWKIGEMAAINNNEFLVLEAALRGTTDIKRIYKIDISGATAVTSGLYGGKTLEALVDATGLSSNGIISVSKTLFMDLLANGWPATLEKAEGLAIIDDSTIAIGNDNDYGQLSPTENGIAIENGIVSHVLTYRLDGSNKITNLSTSTPTLAQGQTGPSTLTTPYILPTIPGAQFTSILTAGDVVGGYKMSGIPDGTGAFDNGDNTFTLLVNHEIPATGGVVRAHGSTGAYVSKWIINKSDLSVVSGSDLIQTVNVWNKDFSRFDQKTTAFARFCSADLPAATAFYNTESGLGTPERIFLNGEETGAEGRAFGHIVTGANAGTTYELPYLGKYSWENAIACPVASDKTLVAGTDDATPGQVYMYIGTKTNTGTEIDKAGLNNGKLFGIAVSGLLTEISASFPAPNTSFTMVDLGQVQNISGSQLNTNSNAAGVTNFLRPEDGAWDPSNPSNFYFATTNSFTAPSRVWKLSFTDIHNPELGGTITAVLDGTEGHKMIDNLTIDNYGHILLQEDIGNNAQIGKIWQYTIASDALIQVGKHDESRFILGAPNFLTQDEEASGIIDVQSILGQGHFLMVDQAHYSISGEVYEGGQILSYFNPDTYNAAPNAFAITGGGLYCFTGTGKEVGLSKSEIGVSYQLILNGTTNVSTAITGTGETISFGNQTDGIYTALATNINTGATQNMTGSVAVTENAAIMVDAGTNQMVYVGYAPQSCVTLTASVSGGTSGYNYLWSTGETTMSISVCPTDTTIYSVTVTDSLGCTSSNTVKVCAQNVLCSNNSNSKKIIVCHNGASICISENAVASHLAHGDYLGSCGANNCDEETERISQENSIESGLTTSIYPNPASTSNKVVFKVQSLESGNILVDLYNFNGQKVRNLLSKSNSKEGSLEIVINTSDLYPGIYFIKTISSSESKIDKIIITE